MKQQIAYLDLSLSTSALFAEMDFAWAIDCAGIRVCLDGENHSWQRLQALVTQMPVGKQLHLEMTQTQNLSALQEFLSALRSDIDVHLICSDLSLLTQLRSATPKLAILCQTDAQTVL